MGACNFGGSVLGCVSVGMAGADFWTDENRADYREMMNDESLTDDYVDNCLWDNEGDYISEVRELSQRFAEDLQNFIYYRFFEPYKDEETPLEISVDNGYSSGFELRVKDAYGFYREQSKFIDAQAEDYAKYYAEEGIFTAAEWADHVEKAIDFADYALVRFAYNKGLSFIYGGWTGGESTINAENVREYARFEKYGAELAVIWWGFCQRYGTEYNHVGL